MVSETMSAKAILLVLYPDVLRLARLLPTTSTDSSSALRAERAVEKLIIGDRYLSNNLLLCGRNGAGRVRSPAGCVRNSAGHDVGDLREIVANADHLLEFAELRQLRHKLSAVGR